METQRSRQNDGHEESDKYIERESNGYGKREI